MPTFRSPRNPDFKLFSMRLPNTIVFVDGVYSTDDPAEVKALRRHVKAGSLTEELAGEFHEGGVIPTGPPSPVILNPGFVVIPAVASATDDDPDGDCTCGPNEACGDCPAPGPPVEPRYGIDVPADQAPAGPAGEPDAEPDTSWSNRALREHAADLGIKVTERAGKKALLDAIRLAENDDGEDFDPNDPDGS